MILYCLHFMVEGDHWVVEHRTIKVILCDSIPSLLIYSVHQHVHVCALQPVLLQQIQFDQVFVYIVEEDTIGTKTVEEGENTVFILDHTNDGVIKLQHVLVVF